MREIYKSGVTPQQKMVAINNKFGNTDIKYQQGTTRLIYDTLPVTAAIPNTLRFFEDSASRSFPLSNTGSDGNKLGVGETMVIQSITFFGLSYDPATQTFSRIQELSTYSAVQFGMFSFELANNKVIKNVSLLELSQFFDKNTGVTRESTVELETDIVIPPLLNYVCELRFNAQAAFGPPITHIRCVINGAGGILAPRTTF